MNPDLVARDAEGQAYTVRYDAVNAMLLLTEFLKEHCKVEKLEVTVSATAKETSKPSMNRRTAGNQNKHDRQLNRDASQIQKVSAELQMRKSSPQIVLNNQ